MPKTLILYWWSLYQAREVGVCSVGLSGGVGKLGYVGKMPYNPGIGRIQDQYQYHRPKAG